jgi:hypothetical protein
MTSETRRRRLMSRPPIPGPHYYGRIIGGEEGQVISAKDERGIEFNTTTVDANLRYGWETPFVPFMIGDGKDGFVPGEKMYLSIEGKQVAEVTIPRTWIPWIFLDLIYDDRMSLTTIAGEGGLEVKPSGETIQKYLDKVMITAVADVGYAFKEWTGDIATVENAHSALTYILMDDSYTVTATFQELPKVKLAVSTDGKGQIEPMELHSLTEQPANAKIELTAVPDPDWEFIQWKGNIEYVNDPTSPSIVVTMSGEMVALTAEFKPKPRELTITILVPWDVSDDDALNQIPFEVI